MDHEICALVCYGNGHERGRVVHAAAGRKMQLANRRKDRVLVTSPTHIFCESRHPSVLIGGRKEERNRQKKQARRFESKELTEVTQLGLPDGHEPGGAEAARGTRSRWHMSFVYTYPNKANMAMSEVNNELRGSGSTHL